MIAWQDLAAIPGFRPVAEAGRGGQGIACRGDLAGADVVIKVLDPAAFNPVAWKHAQDAATIRHPNVVPIEAAAEITIAGDTYHYIVMPYVDGQSLERELAGGSPLALDTALRWGAQLADALGAFHDKKRVHRDVKPANAIVRADGSIVLIDLELVRYDEFPTATGRWMLSPGYAAQEHAVHNVAEPRSDLFALGIVLYEMLAGQHPFAAPTPAERQNRINGGELPDPLPATVPADIASLVRRLLAHRLLDRPPTATAVAATLRAYAPRRRVLGDIGVGIRASSAKTLIEWCLSHERPDIVVLNASSMGRRPKVSHLRPARGRLLVDPNTDLFAVGQTRDRFPVSVGHWGWAPQPLGNALKTAVDDATLAASILGWQARLKVDALISPYLRLERWTATPPQDLGRTIALVTESIAIARRDWPDFPLLAGIAVPYANFMSAGQRSEILTALTGFNPPPDGVYFIVQGGAIDAAFLAVLKDTGTVLRNAGLEAILAYGGPELVPLLASGSWDAVVTGPSQSHRSPTFKLATGGPSPRDRYQWVLATRLLENLRDERLARVAANDRSLVMCGCDACAQIITTAGTVQYDAASAADHYAAATTRVVAWLRRLDATARAKALSDDLTAAITSAERIDQIRPVTARLNVRRRLEEWKAALL